MNPRAASGILSVNSSANEKKREEPSRKRKLEDRIDQTLLQSSPIKMPRNYRNHLKHADVSSFCGALFTKKREIHVNSISSNLNSNPHLPIDVAELKRQGSDRLKVQSLNTLDLILSNTIQKIDAFSIIVKNINHIEKLSISANDRTIFLDEKYANVLAESLAENSSLKSLKLTNFSDLGMATIINSLQGKPTLLTLDLSRSRATSTYTEEALLKLVQNPNCKLEELTLDTTAFSIDFYVKLSDILKSNRSLMKLSSRYNVIETEGLIAISDMMETNQVIKTSVVSTAGFVSEDLGDLTQEIQEINDNRKNELTSLLCLSRR